MKKDDPILEGEKLGQATSEQLSKYLKKYLDQDDRREVANNTVMSIHTVKNLIYGYTTLSENNYPALIELVKKARKNSKAENKFSAAASKYLSKILKK